MSIGGGKKIKQTMQLQIGWSKSMRQIASRLERIDEQRRKQAAILRSGSVEQLLEKRFLPLGMAVLMAVSVGLGVAGIVALIILRL